MSDAGPPVEPTPQRERAPQRSSSQYTGIFRDKVVRVMAYVAAGLVIAFLVTVVSALFTGVLVPSGPRTVAEKDVAVAAAAIEAGSTDAAVWGRYMATLIAAEQYSRAQGVIDDARASLDDSATAEFTIAEARLHYAKGRYEDAVEAAEAAQKQISEQYEAALAGGGERARLARLDGLHANHGAAALIKAYSYEALGEWGKAIEQFDAYLESTPSAADILIDRGLAKIETGDTPGAEADLRAALAFLPDDREALDGLASIGVTP
ncbi:MAG: tetratricopeptide repeat protein [Coriobacteriia bacterium]